MKLLVCIAILVSASWGAAGAAQAGSSGGAPQDGYWTCATKSSESTVYTSGAFETTATVNDMDKAFSDALKAKYGYAGPAFCGMAYKAGATIDKIKTDQHNQIKQMRGNGKKVIETNWTAGG